MPLECMAKLQVPAKGVFVYMFLLWWVTLA